MRLHQNAASLTLLAGLLAPAASAQSLIYVKSPGPIISGFVTTDEITGSKSWDREVSALGATAIDAELEFDYRLAYSYNSLFKSGRAEGSVSADCDVEVFGAGGSVVDAEFEAWAEDATTSVGGASAGYMAKVRVAGITVYSKSGTTTADLTKTLSGDYTQKWLSLSETFMLGPIPVKVTFSASSSADFSIAAGIKPVSLSAALEGEAELVAGTVSASAGIGFDVAGVVGASAGIAVDIDLFTLTLEADFEVKASSGFSGCLEYTLDAMSLELKLFAEAHVWFIKKEYDLTLLDKSWGSASDCYCF